MEMRDVLSMKMRETLLYLLLLFVLFISFIIFDHSALVLQDCAMTVTSFILIVVSLFALSLTRSPLRSLEERSKVASILVYSAVFMIGLIMAIAILHGVITNRQPEIPRFLLACIFGKSPQDNGVLALSTLAITLIAIVFFAIMTLYGALSLKKLIFSKKLA